MARRGAARREKRIAKREAAKEERGGQKYRNQKGGLNKRAHLHSREKIYGRIDNEAENDVRGASIFLCAKPRNIEIDASLADGRDS